MTPNEFEAAYLNRLTDTDIIRAFVDELDDAPLVGNFQAATGWNIIVGQQRFPHRKIIARAINRRLGQQVTPMDFNGNIDKRIRWWLGEQSFVTQEMRDDQH